MSMNQSAYAILGPFPQQGLSPLHMFLQFYYALVGASHTCTEYRWAINKVHIALQDSPLAGTKC